ncbi:solute carrier family 26 member 6 isoform X1 [Anser cygnoides]|uniref:solute carrier family 26 member 6 isoform X1 n=1 Tax=Anser cygnoides TaxID=8845 RepID=UPI0034D2BA0A
MEAPQHEPRAGLSCGCAWRHLCPAVQIPPSLPRNSVPPGSAPALQHRGLGHRRARDACQGLKFLLPSCVKGQSLRTRLGGWPGLCSAAALPWPCRTWGARGHGHGDGAEPPARGAPWRGAERGRAGRAGAAETSQQDLGARLSPEGEMLSLHRQVPALPLLARPALAAPVPGEGLAAGGHHLGLQRGHHAPAPGARLRAAGRAATRHRPLFLLLPRLPLLLLRDIQAQLRGNTTIVDEVKRDAERVQLVATITILSGVFQVALGLLQFGFVVTYLSDPLVRGYTTAASVHVLISQLKNVFGVSVGEYSGPLSLFKTFIEICRKLPQTNVGTLVTAIIAMVAIFIVKELNHKFASKLPMPIPIELITIIISTGISYGVDLKSKFGISVVGDIPSGLKPPVVPKTTYFGQVVGNAFAIAIVGYAICISLGKIFALKHGYKVDSNQELIALGLSNFLGGFFQCFAISCSMSRSLVQESTGGNSQVAGVLSSLVILVTILKIGELFRDLPKAILAAIIIVNLKGMFKQFTDFRTLWKSNRVDLMIWIVTFVATLLLNLDIGLGASVAFALLTVIFRTQLPHYSLLGRVADTEVYKDVAEYQKAQEIPGVKIFRSSSTLYFANVEMYAEALKKKSGINVDRLIAKKKKVLRKLKKQQKKAEKEKAKRKKATEAECNGPGVAVIELSGEESSAPAEPTLRSLGLPQPDFHAVILDFSSLNFVDTVSIKIVKNIFRDFREIEVDVFVASCPASVLAQLERGNFFSSTITKQCFFPSVHDAVLHISGEQHTAPVRTCPGSPHHRHGEGQPSRPLSSSPSPQAHLSTKM